MESLLSLRNNVIRFIKNYENILAFVLKFFTGLIIYNFILGGSQYMNMFERFNTGAFGLLYIIILALSFAFLPRTINYLIIIGNIGMSLSIYPFVSAFVMIVLLSILVFYGRLAPKESIIALITYFLFTINAPYLIPLIAGLYFSVTAFIPIILGGFLFAFHKATILTINEMITQDIFGIDAISQFIFINKNIMNETLANSPYFVLGFVLAISFFATYFISKLNIDYYREVGILSGGLFCLIGTIFVYFTNDASFSLILAIFMIILSCFITFAVTFFEAILDYNATEKVLFQDDENFYFVKIVPKIYVD